MKWFKHDSSAHTDAKLQKVIMKYRAEGYALYWYSLELIAGKVDKNNITFELEHDAEIIGFQLGIDQLKVQEIMSYMVNLGLFDISQNNQIRCLKMAYRLDETTSKNPEFKHLLSKLKDENTPESLRKVSGKSPEVIGKVSDQTRLDQIRLDKDLLKSTKKKLDFSPLGFADLQIEEFKDLRKKAKSPITQRVINSHAKEFELSRNHGLTNSRILDIWSNRGWKCYKNEWALKHENINASNSINQEPQQRYPRAFDEFEG